MTGRRPKRQPLATDPIRRSGPSVVMPFLESEMNTREPPDDTPIPACLYSCSRDSCAEERSWPASDLHWVPAWEGWYCDLCLDDLHEDEDVEVGISLAAWLKSRRSVSVPCPA